MNFSATVEGGLTAKHLDGSLVFSHTLIKSGSSLSVVASTSFVLAVVTYDNLYWIKALSDELEKQYPLRTMNRYLLINECHESFLQYTLVNETE